MRSAISVEIVASWNPPGINARCYEFNCLYMLLLDMLSVCKREANSVHDRDILNQTISQCM